NGGQSIRLVRSESVQGVAPGYLIATALAAVLWFSWACLVDEHGTMVQTTAGGTVALFNLTWWSLRRLGLVSAPTKKRSSGAALLRARDDRLN
ncbi:hypothetical protein, partial [Brooklawnia sp.]|uniref:hypothetical protein n=1 Tax=Brooklawnia sp. TaxID=2699740 RepID=UPI00311FE0EA